MYYKSLDIPYKSSQDSPKMLQAQDVETLQKQLAEHFALHVPRAVPPQLLATKEVRAWTFQLSG